MTITVEEFREAMRVRDERVRQLENELVEALERVERLQLLLWIEEYKPASLTMHMRERSDVRRRWASCSYAPDHERERCAAIADALDACLAHDDFVGGGR